MEKKNKVQVYTKSRGENGNILWMIIKRSEVRQLRKVSWRLNIVIIAPCFSSYSFFFSFLFCN
jgi:hypothetical protein